MDFWPLCVAHTPPGSFCTASLPSREHLTRKSLGQLAQPASAALPTPARRCFKMLSLEGLASDEPEAEDDDWTLSEANKRDAIKCLLLELEPFVRRVLQEELQRLLSSHASRRPLGDQVEALSASSRWRLSFVGELPNKLFTCGKIETKDGLSIKVVIEDRSTGFVVSIGVLSTIQIEILVIDGDFDVVDLAEWTKQDFAEAVVSERQGRRPLLAGDVTVGLRGGAATLGSLFFTDNSSWTRSRTFRLGARVFSSAGQRVLEAVSGAFSVRDHRGELYKKHHPPAQHDQIWRLEKIGKHGVFHRRLSDKGITTVQDFLRFLVMEPDWLRRGLGMSDRVWKTTVEHAGECRLDGRLFSYYDSGGQVMLVFDSIFQLVGAKFDDREFLLMGDLDHSQRALVNRLKRLAYKNRGDLMEVDLRPPMPRAAAPAGPRPAKTIDDERRLARRTAHSSAAAMPLRGRRRF